MRVELEADVNRNGCIGMSKITNKENLYISYATEYDLYKGDVGINALSAMLQDELIRAVLDPDPLQDFRSFVVSHNIIKRQAEGLWIAVLVTGLELERAKEIRKFEERNSDDIKKIIKELSGALLGVRLTEAFSTTIVSSERTPYNWECLEAVAIEFPDGLESLFVLLEKVEGQPKNSRPYTISTPTKKSMQACYLLETAISLFTTSKVTERDTKDEAKSPVPNLMEISARWTLYLKPPENSNTLREALTAKDGLVIPLGIFLTVETQLRAKYYDGYVLVGSVIAAIISTRTHEAEDIIADITRIVIAKASGDINYKNYIAGDWTSVVSEMIVITIQRTKTTPNQTDYPDLVRTGLIAALNLAINKLKEQKIPLSTNEMTLKSVIATLQHKRIAELFSTKKEASRKNLISKANTKPKRIVLLLAPFLAVIAIGSWIHTNNEGESFLTSIVFGMGTLLCLLFSLTRLGDCLTRLGDWVQKG